MGEVGTGQAICPGACYAVAGGASGAEEKTLATGSPGRLRRGRGALPRLHQRGEIPWPMRDDDKSHQCMGAAAIFGSLPAIAAGLVRMDTPDLSADSTGKLRVGEGVVRR